MRLSAFSRDFSGRKRLGFALIALLQTWKTAGCCSTRSWSRTIAPLYAYALSCICTPITTQTHAHIPHTHTFCFPHRTCIIHSMSPGAHPGAVPGGPQRGRPGGGPGLLAEALPAALHRTRPAPAHRSVCHSMSNLESFISDSTALYFFALYSTVVPLASTDFFAVAAGRGRRPRTPP